MPVIRFVGGEHVDVPSGTSLLDASELTDHELESDCGGVAACNACRVRVVSGFANLSEKGPEEDPFLDSEGQRLGCQALVYGDVEVVAEPGL